MSNGQTWVVGDIQGCYDGLCRLLDKIKFEPHKDQLVAVGDLVARGEDSLATLRLLKSLGNSFTTVLGNHDLHLLAVVHHIKKVKKSDNLSNLLQASDLPELVDWMRSFGLAKAISDNHTIVHAGLYPHWSVSELLRYSNEVSNALQADNYPTLLEQMYGNGPKQWDESLGGIDRLRFIINACTRMRFLNQQGQLDFEVKTHPDSAPPNFIPWFNVKNRKLTKDQKILFGHWAALHGETGKKQFCGLDTGYVWGQSLSAINLSSEKITSVFFSS